jgi:sulfur relay (sulfurtransferase) complex TusBCD TusD component (DsrE family)
MRLQRLYAALLLPASGPLKHCCRSVAQRSGSSIGVCGVCMDSRGITQSELLEGAHRGSMDQLSKWSAWADKVIVF